MLDDPRPPPTRLIASAVGIAPAFRKSSTPAAQTLTAAFVVANHRIERIRSRLSALPTDSSIAADPLEIGALRVWPPVVLAPMAGITNAAFQHALPAFRRRASM